MAFRVDRRFNLLILEEGEDYVADVSASMELERRGKTAAPIKGRLRIGSKSLVFQPDEVSANILKFPFRHLKRIGEVEEAKESFTIESEQLVQVVTKIKETKTRIVTPFSIVKTRVTVTFGVSYASAEEHRSMINRLWEATSGPSASVSFAEHVVKQILQEATVAVNFDMSRLGHRESALLPNYLWVRRVKPLLQVRGMLQISNEAIYFQPHPNFASKPVKRVALSEVLHVFRRTYGIKANALEIITVHGKCMYLCFETQSECDRVVKILQEQRRNVASSGGISNGPGEAEDILHHIHKITALWQSGLLSNFHYLDFLNCAAGRSQNDFSQYPVFPWVLKDYKGSSLNLADPNVYRDLTKPIGALNTKRLDYFKERMCGMPEEEAFLYGTHYSTPAYVIYWLLRAMPERMLRLHTGHFDALPRLFRSVIESWDSVNESTASLMELIPEFFVLPARWLENSLAIMTPEGQLADVILPRWAADFDDFITKMRAALESEFVSRNLPAWIDLIFGFKQSGEEAVKADNLFHPVCYTGSPDSKPPAANSSFSPSVLELQLQEFGRVPRRLFSEAHPPRLKMPKWEPDRLRKDPRQSEPWYKVVRHLSGGDVEAVREARPGSVAPEMPATPPASRAPGEPEARQVEVTVRTLQALGPRAATPLTASGCITGVASCAVNMYSIGEDGCLRVSPLDSSAEEFSARRNFRVSPMPLSALAVLSTDLCVIGGHDNAVTLYSSSCGSALAKHQVHADTVTCLGVSPGGSSLVSGSRDQSVRTWHITASTLKNEATFDDIPQAITCAAAGRNLVLAGAEDGQLMAWDLRTGQAELDREMGGDIVSCALSSDDTLAAALDCTGEFRLWDLRHRCESVRLPVAARTGACLSSATCFLTDFAGWAVLGGVSVCNNPAVVLWDIPEQRELRTWELSRDGAGGDVRFLVQPDCVGERGSDGTYFLCANATGAVHMFSRH